MGRSEGWTRWAEWDRRTWTQLVARRCRALVTRGPAAERLFVSRHTVGYHLHKVYAQLGIASRAELGQLDLDDDDSR
jgi:hypothetical protein